jgi:transcriptional regulator NrdR family protein
MKCPNPECKATHESLGVIESRQAGDTAIRRRRKCLRCGYRFTTLELEPVISNRINSRRMGDYVLIEKAEFERIKRLVKGQAEAMVRIAKSLED